MAEANGPSERTFARAHLQRSHNTVEALLRSSEALAQLLEAGCRPIAELLGRRLMALE